MSLDLPGCWRHLARATGAAHRRSEALEERFDNSELAGLWARALSAWHDAGVTGLSTEGAFIRAYDAARQAAVTVLAAHGLRVKSGPGHHYITFYALGALEVLELSDFGTEFEAVRNSRHLAAYEAELDPDVLLGDLARLRCAIVRFLPVARRHLISQLPALEAKLGSNPCPSRVSQHEIEGQV
jgi:hypothetical protein